MQKWLLVFVLLFSQAVTAQRGMVFVKKNGYKKVHSFAEGDPITFQVKDGFITSGYISLVRNDSIYVNGMGFSARSVSRIFLREKKHELPRQFLLTTGYVLVIAGAASVSKNYSFGSALGIAAILGYGQLLIRQIPNLKRYKYKIGKKFSIQTLDLHF
jgi:hypothetical protein